MKKVSACERELHMEVSQIKVELADIEVKIEGLRYVSQYKTENRSMHENCGLEVKKVEVGIIKRIVSKAESIGVQLRMPEITERGEYECSPVMINDGKALSDIFNQQK